MLGSFRPKLEAFRLISASIETSEGPRSRERPWAFTVSNDVQIGFAFPKIESEPTRAILKDHYTVEGKPADGEAGSATIDVTYHVAFVMGSQVTQTDIDIAMSDDDELQYALIAQAHALSVSKLKDLMQECGFNSAALAFDL